MTGSTGRRRVLVVGGVLACLLALGAGFGAVTATESADEATEPTDAAADFQLSDLSVPANVSADESVRVFVDIDNTGTAEATQTVELRVDGSVVDTTDVTLPAGGAGTLQFRFGTGSLSAGSYTVGVYTDNDSETASTTVRVGESCDLSTFVQRYDAGGDCAISLTELGRASADFANGDITLTQLGRVSTAFANTS